ncbi:MAG: pseudouridine-5'-phosphate glycosidase [Armatimonadota bacterium]|nr:pseudouridine-5'-phosphate glycosidase [Armatimonadota bacterium]
MRIHAEVASALAGGVPVVALETTLFAHGLPSSVVHRVQQDVEAAVREEGAVPAAIAVLEGEIRVGLGPEDWRAVFDRPLDKAGLRDLPGAVAKRRDAATTVASTAYLASRAGIRVFATGGIGGVHRDASRTWDVSGDLTVLSRTPVVVVCSGAKSVLDLPATLEALETLQVTVLGFRVDRFPAFYVADSGLPVPRVESEAEVAAIVRARDALGLASAVVVAQPPPPGAALDPEVHDAALADALRAAEGVRGKEVTPVLLRRLAEATGGAAVEANRHLAVANARLAARIARALVGH